MSETYTLFMVIDGIGMGESGVGEGGVGEGGVGEGANPFFFVWILIFQHKQ